MWEIGTRVRVKAGSYHNYPDGTIGMIDKEYGGLFRVRGVSAAYPATQLIDSKDIEAIPEEDETVGPEDF